MSLKHLFVYGSLLFPEIVEGLCGKPIQSEQAILNGYRRCAIVGADYPAIIQDNTCKVTGQLLTNLDKQSLEILGFYEGNQYRITEAEVIVVPFQEKKQALVYTWQSPINELLPFDWDKNYFEREALAFYVTEVVPETVEEFRNINSRPLQADRLSSIKDT